MTGTSLYNKVKTRGGHTMMNKDGAMKHPKDDWGFEHGKKYHRSIIGGGPDAGKPAPGHAKGDDEMQQGENSSPNKHVRTTDGSYMWEHTHGGTTLHGKKNKKNK